MNEISKKELCLKAIDAMNNSYAPYSHFNVGAALLTSDGRVFTGCNIENSAFSPTVCAERVAVFKAVSEGARKFAMLAVVGGNNGKVDSKTTPCGVCRQVMGEFCSPNFTVLAVKSPIGEYDEYTLNELLPEAFRF